MRTNGWLWALTIASAGHASSGAWNRLALTPLQTGDVYPPFSTLRADPLGAKALYEKAQPSCPASSSSGSTNNAQ